jgi:hypothetical protein
MDLNTRMNHIHRLLKADGYLIIAVPNIDSYDAKSYGSYWAAYDIPRHLYHFSRKTMNILINRNGFTVTSILPICLDAIYISIMSEKYKTGRSGFIKGSMNGLRSIAHAWFNDREYSSLIYVVKKNNE